MIQLDQYFTVKTDTNNFILSFRRQKKLDKPVKLKDGTFRDTVEEKEDWFYPNLYLCLKTYLNEVVRLELSSDDIISAEKLMSLIEETEENLKSITWK